MSTSRSCTETVLHTAGPWKVERHPDDLPGVTTMNDEPICDVYEHGAPDAAGNASLIAAAPDLLHALDCILWRHMEDEFIPTEFWDMAKEAVKKAKGA